MWQVVVTVIDYICDVIAPCLLTGLSMVGSQDQQSMPSKPYSIKLTAKF